MEIFGGFSIGMQKLDARICFRVLSCRKKALSQVPKAPFTANTCRIEAQISVLGVNFYLSDISI